MKNKELIKRLRAISGAIGHSNIRENGGFDVCVDEEIGEAADALEQADEDIAELIGDLEFYAPYEARATIARAKAGRI